MTMMITQSIGLAVERSRVRLEYSTFGHYTIRRRLWASYSHSHSV